MTAALIREALQTNRQPTTARYQRIEPITRSKTIRVARFTANANGRTQIKLKAPATETTAKV